MKLNITNVTSCDSRIVIPVPKVLHHYWKWTDMKHEFVKLALIFFTYNKRCGYAIPSNFV